MEVAGRHVHPAAQAHPHRAMGVRIGVSGPVDFTTGRLVAPPIMPGWDEYSVRSWFRDRYDAPVWVDNDVNLMALGRMAPGITRRMVATCSTS